MKLSISTTARAVIDAYLHIRIGLQEVSCPYFNNRRTKLRASLRALVGKGSPEDIAEEANILALKEKIDLSHTSQAAVRRFLVDHHLGVDCSAFAYYVLDAECRARQRGRLRDYLVFAGLPFPRRLIASFRPIENTSVRTLADERNSFVVALSDVKPADIVIMLGAGESRDRDHLLVVEEVEYTDNQPTNITYAHSLRWRTDGQCNHGVRHGRIELAPTNASLLDVGWIEQDKFGEENETFTRATGAQCLEIRRLKALA